MFQNGVVEGEGFKELVPYLIIEYVTPARATLTKHIKKHFEKRKEELKYKLARADKLALTAGQLSQTADSDSFLPSDVRQPQRVPDVFHIILHFYVMMAKARKTRSRLRI